MGYFATLDRPYLRSLQCNHGYCLSVERNELHLKSPALAIYMHDRADIAGSKLLVNQVRRKDNTVMLFDCVHVRSYKG